MYSLISLLMKIIDLFELLLLVACIMSWVPVYSGTVGDIKEALRKLTDPFLEVIRDLIPMVSRNGLGIDFSPMVAIIALDLIKRILYRLFWVVF